MQRGHHLAVVVVHHTRKNGGGAVLGQTLRGSGDFHAWVDSSLYLRRKRDSLTLSIEHRSAPSPDPLHLALVGDDATGDVHLELCDDDATGDAPDRDLAAHVLGALLEQPRTRTDLRALLRVRNQRLGSVLEQLREAGRVRRHAGVWLSIPVPNP